jgi:hypothetical protein
LPAGVLRRLPEAGVLTPLLAEERREKNIFMC